MTLNKFMHPRNKYFNNPPDFSKLCEKYPEFKKHTSASSSNKVHVDFKDPEALRSLTCTLLKEDFDLDVHLPIDRIIPTVPLRLNYVLWIEDLLAKSDLKEEEQVIGIDIGCGSSCIYGLLGFKLNKWKFIASEVDALSLQYANENVQANDAEQYIKVYEAAENTMLLEIVNDNPQPSYHFTMCNPPFFGNMLEAQGILSRSMDRAEPRSMSTAAEVECIADGGEVEFVKRMIQDSLKLRHKILWFTSMLGKKTSLPLLKQELHKHKISHFTTTEFCQGRTMRWGIAWTFHQEIEILPPAKRFKPSKEKPPLMISVPPKYIEKVLSTHSKAKAQLNMIKLLCKEIKKCFRNLEITFSKTQSMTTLPVYHLTAIKNTWSKQRQKRREQKRLEDNKNMGLPGTSNHGNGNVNELEFDEDVTNVEPSEKRNAEAETQLASEQCTTDRETLPAIGNKKTDKEENILVNCVNEDSTIVKCNGENIGTANQCVNHENKTENTEKSLPTGNDFLFKCLLGLQMVDGNVFMEMHWLEGKTRELMHQLGQYFKNYFKREISIYIQEKFF